MTTRAEKVIWLFFAATSIQLAFLQPYVVLAPGQRVNLFSGLLCFLSLIVALILARRGAIKVKSPEFLVSVALVVLGVTKRSPQPDPPGFVSPGLRPVGLGVGRLLVRPDLTEHPGKPAPLPVALPLSAGWGRALEPGRIPAHGRIDYYFFKGSNHPLTDVIFLLSFAPLALLARKSRASVLLGCGSAGPELHRPVPQ